MTSGGTRAGRVHRIVRLLRQGSGDDALSLGDRRRAEVHWPAHVLGRCVVLRAHELAGKRALRAVTESDLPAVRLWRRAFDDVLSWDAGELHRWLGEPRQMTIRCGGTSHQLVLDGDQLGQRAHGALDLDTERAGLALGGTVADCVRCLLSWQEGEPAAAEAVRSAGPLSILRWLAVTRSWTVAGWSPERSWVAVQQGLSCEDLQRHLGAGLSLERAVAWSAWAADDVQRWRAVGASPQSAATWRLQARSVGAAENGVRLLAAAGVPDEFESLVTWARHTGRRVSVEDLVDWVASGLPTSHWAELAVRGMSYDQAAAWIAMGFRPAAILRYAHLRMSPGDAQAWQYAGFNSRDACSFVASGIDILEATALRDLPVPA